MVSISLGPREFTCWIILRWQYRLQLLISFDCFILVNKGQCPSASWLICRILASGHGDELELSELDAPSLLGPTDDHHISSAIANGHRWQSDLQS